MKRFPIFALAFACVMAIGSSPSTARAYGFEMHNETPNMVWGARASQKFWILFCQESDCNEKYRVVGWWAIAPGGFAWIDTVDFHKKHHDWYAEDAVGHVWAGHKQHCSPWSAFNFCEPHTCTANDRMIGYREKTNSSCCGVTCGGDWGYVFLVL